MTPSLSPLARVVRFPVAAALFSITALLGACTDAPTPPTALTPSGPSMVAGTSSVLAIDPGSLAFGNVNVGQISQQQIVTVSNKGTGDLHLSSVALSGPNGSQFFGGSVTQGMCSGEVPVPPGGSCVIPVVFAPSAVGSMGANLDVMTDGGNATLLLTGTGFDPAPSLVVSPTSLFFGTQTIGTASAAQQIVVTNIGGSDMTLGSIALAGGSAGDFVLTSGITTLSTSTPPCQTSVKIPVGASCGIYVTFSPTKIGGRSATVDIQSDGGAASVLLSGNGAVSDLAVSMGATPSPAQVGKPLTYTITITNLGPGAASGVSLIDVIPASTTFVSYAAPPAAMTCTAPAVGSTGTLACSTIVPVPSGTSLTVKLVVKPLSGGKGSISNTVNVQGTAPDPLLTNNGATVITSVYGRK